MACEAICCNDKPCSKTGRYAIEIDGRTRMLCSVHKGVKKLRLAEDIGECSICYELCTEKDSLVLNCQHVFHKKCTLLWIQQNKTTCPYCRTEISMSILEEIDPVYYARKELYDLMSNTLVIRTPRANLTIAPSLLDLDTMEGMRNGINEYIENVRRLREIIRVT